MPTSSTKNYTAQDLLNSIVGEHNAIADANGNLLVGGGVYASTPTAVAAGDLVRSWHNAYGYSVPERQAILIGSLTTASGTTTAVLGSQVGLGAFKNLDLLIDVTATGGTASTLAMYVDSRLDGTNWTNIGAGTIQTTISQQVVHLSKQQVGGFVMVTSLVNPGTVRPIGWADDIQVRYSITGTTAAFDLRVFFCVGP